MGILQRELPSGVMPLAAIIMTSNCSFTCCAKHGREKAARPPQKLPADEVDAHPGIAKEKALPGPTEWHPSEVPQQRCPAHTMPTQGSERGKCS